MFDVAEVEPQQFAQQMLDDLRAFLDKRQSAELVTLSLDQNLITMRASSGQSVKIVVDGPNAFRVEEDLGNKRGGVQTQVTATMARWSLSERPFGQDEMVRRVTTWLAER